MWRMTYHDDVLQELVGRRARDREEELDALKRQIAVLQRTVAALASILDDEGVGGGSSSFRARMADAMQRASVPIDDETYPDEVERKAPAMIGSAYRGPVPTAAGLGCSVCGRALEPDDPELTLAAGGAVCLGCFQRAR